MRRLLAMRRTAVLLVALLATFVAQSPAFANNLLLGVSSSSTQQVSYVGPIANNTLLPTGLITTGQATQLTIHTSNNGVSNLRIGLAKAYFTGNYLKLTPLPGSYTVNEISVRLVSGGTVTTIVTNRTVTPWDGTRAGATVDWVDLTPVVSAIPAGTQFYIFIACTGANLPSVTSLGSALINTDEFLRTTAGAPTTFTTTITQTDANRRTRLGAIVGIEGTRTGKSVAVIGDSLTANISSALAIADGYFPDRNRGIVPNMIGFAYDYVNLGIGGDQWENRLFDRKMHDELLANATNVVLALGINSFNNKAQTSETTPISYVRSYLPRLNGKAVHLAEITPHTSGAWTLADGSDQSYRTYGGVSAAVIHPAYNSALAATPGVNVLAVRSAFALSGDANKIHANGTIGFATPDGLHFTKAAIDRATASYGATARSLIAAGTPLSGASQPSRTMTGTLSFGGGKLTNGTATRNDIEPGTAIFSMSFKVTLGASLASAFIVLPNLANGWPKYLQINTAGTLTLANQSSATVTTTAALNFSAENTITITVDGTNIYLFVNGTFANSIAIGGNSTVRPDFAIAASTASNVSVRDLSMWDYCLATSGSLTVPNPTGSETGLIAYYPLATNAVPVLGTSLP